MQTGEKKIPENLLPDFDRLVEELHEREGYRAYAYDDKTSKKIDFSPVCQGNVTIGIGLNISAGMSLDLSKKITFIICYDRHETLSRFDWYRELSPARKEVLIEMSYQMGVGNERRGLLSFREMIASIRHRNIDGARIEMLDSLVARRHPKRYMILSQKWERG